jgi:hypothetical protein
LIIGEGPFLPARFLATTALKKRKEKNKIKEN